MGGINWVKIAERRLEREGWLETVAGHDDWSAVLAAFTEGMCAKPPRGALLSGSFGCGKTMAATALYKIEGIDHSNNANAYAGIVLACAACEDWHYDANAAYAHPLGWTVLDDMGAETLPELGRKDIVGERVMRIHKRWSCGLGGGVAVTTNLTGEQMAARYGGRVMSRLMEMIVPVRLTGHDKRQRVTVQV